jgi:hypothetical protein
MDRDAADRVLLGVLLDEPKAHFSTGELETELGWPAFRIEDALAELVRSGLAHRHGDFAWASRAAGRAAELV